MKKPKRIVASLLAMLLVIGSNNLSHFIANAENETPDGQVTEGELVDNNSETVAEVIPTPDSTAENLATEQPEPTVTEEMSEELSDTVEPATEKIEEPTENQEVQPNLETTSIPTVEPEILVYTTETNLYQVTAVVEPGSFSEKVQLQAIEIATNSEEYSVAVESVAKEKNTNKDEFEEQYQMAALDIHFVNESGVEVEPNENKKVSVSIDFKNVREILGDNTDTNTMEIHHIDDNKNVEVVANNNEIEVNTTTNTATATFEVAQFSVFTVTWQSWKDTSISVKYVDENLNEIDAFGAKGQSLSSGKTYTFPNDMVIAGYTYKGTYVDSYNGSNKINSITATYNQGRWSYSTDTRVSVNANSTFYMVYKNDSQGESVNPTPGGTVTDVDQLTKHKTVEPLGNDQYQLSLDVMGSQGTEENPTLIDILFIIDNSGSMKYSMSSENAASYPNRRIDKVNEAIQTLVNTIDANKKIDAHYAAVKFAGSKSNNDGAYNDASVINYYTSDSTSFLNSLKSLSPDGGTNYQAGIRTAKTVLTSNSARANAKKIVVFLSDGVPTYRYDSNGKTIGAGNAYAKENLTNANTEIANLAAHAFYTIGVADGYDEYKDKLESICSSAKSVTGEKVSYSGKNLTALKEAFANITSSIINYAVSNVTVTDTLSNNAEFARLVDGKPTFHITVTDASGTKIAEADNKVKVEGKEIVANYNGKQFWMDFEDDYVLNPNYKYTISTTIQPTTSAYEYYRMNGTYPNTGDLGTGSASSEKDGFYSNDGATVQYTYRNNVKTENYLKPVIQVTTLNIEGTKTWIDDNNHEGLRPESITIRLFRGTSDTGLSTTASNPNWTYQFERIRKYQDGKELTYNVQEDEVANYQTTINGYNITNTREIEKISVSGKKTWDDADNQDGKRPDQITVHLLANGVDTGRTATTNANSNWEYTFEDVDKYANGTEITYTVSENAVAEYQPTYDGMNVTNSHTPIKIKITGTKTWDDANNQDGKRPAQITVNLLANGNVVKTKNVTGDDNWTYEFDDLDEYKDGQKINYTITEEAVTDYSTVVDGYNITNTHEVETTTISGTKTWDDSNNQDGKRPSQITVKLLADGEVIGTKIVTANDNWSYSFENLPVYKEGQQGVKVVYTIDEGDVAEYTKAVSGNNITNRYTPETVYVGGLKTWNDSNNQDGKRPNQITIYLYADGQKIDETTTNGKVDFLGSWVYSFGELPKYKNGEEIQYTVVEEEIAGYTATYDGFDITNTHEVEKINISGTKTWDDSNNQDGKRPNQIEVKLLADGEVIGTKTVTASDNWEYSFTNLDKYKLGQEINYTVTEKAIEGYTTTVNGYNITNSYTPETTFVSGTKTWNDANNQDGIRPNQITVNLLANGEQIDSKQVSSNDNWKYEFTNLPVYKDGQVITYTVSENEVEGYSTQVTGYNITNTHTPETVSFGGTKKWVDNNNQDGIRPNQVTVKLFANGVDTEKTTIASADSGWTYAFENVDKYRNGEVIKYTIQEVEVEGYTTSIFGNTITNTHEVEKTSVSVTKTWDDANNQDGIRPTTITINLYGNNEFVASKRISQAQDGSWTYTFDQLDKYSNGNEIQYTVTEEAVEGYTTEINGFDITNTHKPSEVTVTGIKTWNDDNNRDGIRPESITVKLLADGEETSETRTVSERTNWTYTFENLPEFKAGNKITYTVVEVDVPNGYEASISGNNITNTHEIETVDIIGTKTWDDNNNQDGIRPESIQVQLYADGVALEGKTYDTTSELSWKYEFKNLPKNSSNGQAIVYEVKEVAVPRGYEASVNGVDITNTHKTYTIDISGIKTWNDVDNQDGKRPTSITVRLLANGEEVMSQEVTAESNWEYKFEKVAQYANGQRITYTVVEDEVEGYTTEINGFDITNSHEVEKISISGTKTWDDADNQDGKRPETITVRLLANGEEVDFQEVTADSSWTYTVEQLDKYSNGNEIQYTVTEDSVEGYTTEINGFDITNSHEVEKISISGTKTWNDANNQDGIRPTTITVNLYGNDELVASKRVSQAQDGSWTYTFDELDKYSNGNEIQYTVTEEAVDGYTTEINGFDITNSHEVEKISISGTKTWDDADNQDGKRPETITVRLLANGEEVDFQEVTADSDWTYTFEQLDKYSNGNEIQYTVTEDPVEGYTTEINGFDITNSHEVEKISISGTKTWNDADNQDGIRPTSITVNLYGNDELVASKRVSQTQDGSWIYTFDELDKYSNGNDIQYTVTEDPVDGYTTEINGFDITNSHEVEKISISGTKTWDDADNQDGKRPETITVRLLANGEEVDFQEVTADSSWTYTFEQLDKYSNGNEIQYTVREDAVEDYSTSYDGNDIVNAYTPEETSITIDKTWNDNDNQDGIRPDRITVRLLANEEEVRQVTITSENQWTTTIDHLPVYQNGQRITYTVIEDEVEGYTTEINDFNIINTHETSTIDITGTKTWDDADNQDGKRPESITVRLLANGEEIAQQVVNADTDWTYTFEGVDQFAQGEEIEYTVMEDAVSEYESIITGFDITNVHKPNQITISGTKTWNDNDDELGLRPSTIIVNLYADGEFVTSKEVTEDTNWTYEFTELDEYQLGQKVIYTITEEPVDQYVTTIDGNNIINTVRPHTPVTNYNSVSIEKVDQNGNQVIGAELELRDSDGTVVDHWTTDGTIHEFEQIEVNKEYVLHEVSAPDGYDIAADVKFVIAEEEENKVITMIDQKQNRPTTPTTPSRPKTPNTGDQNDIVLYGVIGLTSLLVAFIALLKRRREVK